MNFNFELILFCAVIISGVIALFDLIFLLPRRKKLQNRKTPVLIEYAYSFFPILVLVFFLRSFAYEPFRIPSGSLKPTLLVGDFILVNKYDYGIRLPVFHNKILAISEPKRGDIVVFREPPRPSIDLIKRVIGVPGDHIQYINKVLYVNGEKAIQQFEQVAKDEEAGEQSLQLVQNQEDLLGVKHSIYLNPGVVNDDFDITVPADNYFMMGDNRDNSSDSRYWGFMPEENIIGKAISVWLSYDTPTHPIRWERVGKKII